MRIIDDSPLWSPIRSSRRGLALGLLADGVGHAGLGDLRAVVLGDGRVVLAELLADRLHLLAQHVLALLLRRALLDVVADAPANLQLGEPLALQPQRELQPLDDVDRLEQLDLLVEGDVGRVGGGVGERAGLADRADEGRDAAVVAAQLEDLLDGRAVLGLELAGLDARRLLVGPLVDLDAEVALRIGVRRAELGAVEAGEVTARPPPGMRTRSPTSATVPTFAYSPSWRGTSSTRSSSPTSTAMVTFMFGKTTRSSRGISKNCDTKAPSVQSLMVLQRMK